MDMIPVILHVHTCSMFSIGENIRQEPIQPSFAQMDTDPAVLCFPSPATVHPDVCQLVLPELPYILLKGRYHIACATPNEQ